MLSNCEYRFHSCKDQGSMYLKIILEMYSGKVMLIEAFLMFYSKDQNLEAEF